MIYCLSFYFGVFYLSFKAGIYTVVLSVLLVDTLNTCGPEKTFILTLSFCSFRVTHHSDGHTGLPKRTELIWSNGEQPTHAS